MLNRLLALLVFVWNNILHSEFDIFLYVYMDLQCFCLSGY